MSIFYSILFLVVVQNVAGDGTKIKVEQGYLEGEILDLVTGDGQYYSFKGIPYALPPNGTWRFKAPQPPLSWTGVRSAKQYCALCPQFDFLTNSFISGSEDCLCLNMYKPKIETENLLPVIVFIHGGSYKFGSGDDTTYGPDFIVRKGVILVTLNYRLDALGFLCLGTKEAPGNQGLKDQNAALKWVQRNIIHFGGDPEKVTIMGQSAGSASVAFHIASPMSQGLFHRAIAASGSPYCDWSLPFQPTRRAFVLGKKLGFETEDPDKLLEFLQSVPSDDLVATSPNVIASEEAIYNIIKMYQFVPCVEKFNGTDNFLSYNIFENIDHTNKVDIMFGHTNQETSIVTDYMISTLMPVYDKYPEILVPRKTMYKLGPVDVLELADKIRKYYLGMKTIDENCIKEFMTYANGISFGYDIVRYFNNIPSIKKNIFAYKFSVYSSRNLYGAQGEKYGITNAVAHMDDLFYLFNPTAVNMPLAKNSTEFKLIDKVCTIFTDFAKYGKPDCSYKSESGIEWPQYDNETMQYMEIGNDNLTVGSWKDDQDYKFWDDFYKNEVGAYI